MARKGLDRHAQLADAARRLGAPRADGLEHELGEGGRECGDGADRSTGQTLGGSATSGPTNTSRPSIRYGWKRSHGASETFMPARFGAASRSRSITVGGTA